MNWKTGDRRVDCDASFPPNGTGLSCECRLDLFCLRISGLGRMLRNLAASDCSKSNPNSIAPDSQGEYKGLGRFIAAFPPGLVE